MVNIILFGRNSNVFWMDKASYEKALKNEDDSSIVEKALTKDGIENYSYVGEGNENNVDKEKTRTSVNPFLLYGQPIQSILRWSVRITVK
jgi:dipeptidyl-peptidase-4